MSIEDQKSETAKRERPSWFMPGTMLFAPQVAEHPLNDPRGPARVIASYDPREGLYHQRWQRFMSLVWWTLPATTISLIFGAMLNHHALVTLSTGYMALIVAASAFVLALAGQLYDMYQLYATKAHAPLDQIHFSDTRENSRFTPSLGAFFHGLLINPLGYGQWMYGPNAAQYGHQPSKIKQALMSIGNILAWAGIMSISFGLLEGVGTVWILALIGATCSGVAQLVIYCNNRKTPHVDPAPQIINTNETRAEAAPAPSNASIAGCDLYVAWGEANRIKLAAEQPLIGTADDPWAARACRWFAAKSCGGRQDTAGENADTPLLSPGNDYQAQ